MFRMNAFSKLGFPSDFVETLRPINPFPIVEPRYDSAKAK